MHVCLPPLACGSVKQHGGLLEVVPACGWIAVPDNAMRLRAQRRRFLCKMLRMSFAPCEARRHPLQRSANRLLRCSRLYAQASQPDFLVRVCRRFNLPLVANVLWMYLLFVFRVVCVMQAQSGRRHIITFCHSMDQMLGGGVAVGEVTEFCGAPGQRLSNSIFIEKVLACSG